MKTIYILAPLRGDLEKNIEFATAAAKKVFADGNIPICPHLMFPPIANPENPTEDTKAMEMCLKLVERCDEMQVCGDNITDGMRREIRHAEKHNIPVFTEQHEVFKTQKPKMNLLGADGNVFYLLGCASRLLRRVGEHDKAQEMSDRVQKSGSYHEALNIISEYVETELSIEMPIAKTPTKSNKTKEKRNHNER